MLFEQRWILHERKTQTNNRTVRVVRRIRVFCVIVLDFIEVHAAGRATDNCGDDVVRRTVFGEETDEK